MKPDRQLSFKISARDQELLRLAAGQASSTVSTFVLDAARVRATEVLLQGIPRLQQPARKQLVKILGPNGREKLREMMSQDFSRLQIFIAELNEPEKTASAHTASAHIEYSTEDESKTALTPTN